MYRGEHNSRFELGSLNDVNKNVNETLSFQRFFMLCDRALNDYNAFPAEKETLCK